jgi:drug/metabolite transporter (DMT)-like permease
MSADLDLADSSTSTKAKRPAIQPYLPLMFVTTIIWGAAFPISKSGLGDVPAATFAFVRFVIAAAILVPMVFILRKGFHIERRDWPKVVLAGILGFVVIQLGQNWGLSKSPASDIAILTTTEPVSIALLAAYFLKEKPAPLFWGGLALSLAGVLTVIGVNPATLFMPSAGPSEGDNRLLGDLLFLGGTLGFAGYNILNRGLSKRIDGLEFTGGAVAVGVLGLLPFALIEVFAGTAPINFTGRAWGGILFTALLVTVFGFLALSWSLKRVTAARVALLFYLQPLSGVIISWFGGEQLTWNFGVGAVMILGGVYIAEKASRARNI